MRTSIVFITLFLAAAALPAHAQSPGAIAPPASVAAAPQSPIAVVGRPLPAWQAGYLDLHHINTGRGNASYYILPDGTTMLFDAGELDPSNPRTTSKRNTPIRPNGRQPYE